MTVIELGDLTSGSPQRPPREFDRRIVSRVALIVVGVLTALGVTASARPQSLAIRTLWSTPFQNGDRYMIDGDTVYTQASQPGARFRAFRLADGRPLWSMTMPDDQGWPTEVESAHVLLIPAGTGTVAVDSRTGAELWHLPGSAHSVSDRAVLLIDQSEDGSAVHGLRLAGLRDGKIVWTHPALGTVQLVAGRTAPLEPQTLVAVHPDGAAEVLRWADGVRLAAARIEWRSGAGFDGTFSELDADGRNLYVRLADGHGSSLTAYALDTLQQAWRQDDAARVSAYACGPVICSVDDDGFAAYDIVTGAARWRSAGVQDAQPAGPGRMLIAEGAPDAYVLVDQLTGARIADLGTGTPLRDYSGRALYLVRALRSPAGMTALSRVDPDTGAVRLVGAIRTYADFGCEFTPARAVCPNPGRQLTISSVD